jgi:hypothetical protein
LQAPPPPGSLQEWVLILVLDRQETIEHAKFRAQAQLLLTVGVDSADAKEAGVKAFDDYMKTAFPGLESKRKSKEDATKKMLKEWISQGPLKVTPSAQMQRVKSKMVHRVEDVSRGRQSTVYRKLGEGRYGSR